MTQGVSDVISVRGLAHGFGGAPIVTVAQWSLAQGDACVLSGPSGSGKTTLLHCLAGLLTPQQGTIHVLGNNLTAMSEAARDRFRGQHIGILFQRHHLIPSLSVAGNLALARTLSGRAPDIARLRDLLGALALSHRADAAPQTLSGGEALRACLARALISEPKLLLADEPTASLDDAAAALAIALIRRETQRNGAALVVATHDARVLQHFEKRLILSGGAQVLA